MTTIDIINMLSTEHNLTSGRAEMILSIVVERITERLKSEGRVKIDNFGEFIVVKNTFAEMIISDHLTAKHRVVFEPGREFLDTININ
ncbi:MAG TPA: HU family DNA-binding protein [Ignavibacteria bacterium]|nr:HU family DNA-binding protein [Ignavibacteria bacterium]